MDSSSCPKGTTMDERNQDIITLLSDESFQRWLTGKASDEENTQWHTWLQ